MIPKIMDVMRERFTAAYIQLNEGSPGNPLLRHIAQLINQVKDIHATHIR
jgi:hypothetical protein